MVMIYFLGTDRVEIWKKNWIWKIQGIGWKKINIWTFMEI